jgi:DNA polymerase-3 subunit alpha
MESLENKSLYLMGIISSPVTKLNKKGNPYGKFVLEDKSASMEFALFGDDYTRFHNFMVEGYFVFVKAVVKRRMFLCSITYEYS